MKLFKTKKDLNHWRSQCAKQPIGFVPTMGALHEGHLSLVREAKKECKRVVVSIFINQLQFSPHEDFNQYPRLIERDMRLLKNENVDVLFLPSEEQMYPNKLGFELIEKNISYKLEGASRPDFFSGVLTVVLKLLNLVQPNIVYFGEKDIQQLCVVKKMIEDFNFPIILRACATIREKNGLAMSSRNQYLTKKDQLKASVLYKGLQKGQQLILKQKKINDIKITMTKIIEQKNIIIDYLDIVDLQTFNSIKNYNNNTMVIVGAVYYKKIRLIDNIIIP